MSISIGTSSSYVAARQVSGVVENIFWTHAQEAQKIGLTDLAEVPDAQTIERMLDVAFWTSLRKEEGQSPKISLAYVSPEQVEHPLLLSQYLPLDANALLKIAPGFERAGIHLGVWKNDEDDLYIWGSTSTVPHLSFTVDVSEPGLLVIKHRRSDGLDKFANVAVLNGDDIKIVSENSNNMIDCPKILQSMLDIEITSYHKDSAQLHILLQLAVSMRAHRRGGTILIVPTNSSNWRYSISQPLLHEIVPTYKGLLSLTGAQEQELDSGDWKQAAAKEIDKIAGLTAIDGAIIINDSMEVIAFGEKIIRQGNRPSVESILLTEPTVGYVPKTVHPALHGGTRHLSAAQFTQDQQDALALVASQDGKFTTYSWSPCKNIVQAHRMDWLLL
jgi:DNA integrity scanning protein DisA with diadenylate cyclase activity